jgi:ankyrin repeat protein
MSGCLDNPEIKKRKKDDEFFHPKKDQQSGIRLQFPFLEYAATNWYIHTRRAALAGMDLSSFYLVLDGFVANKQRFIAWLDIGWPKNIIQGLTPLHAVAKTGLAQYATHLLQKGDVDPNAQSSFGDPPLYWAASCGHANVAKILIDNGADPDGEANEGYMPLHVAASKNRAEVIKVLLAAGVDPLTPKTKEAPGMFCGNAPSSVGETPLMYACNNGHSKAVAEFLPYLTDPDKIMKALFWSAGSGNAACVDLILHHATVDVNAQYRGESLLFKACTKCDLNTIKLILAAGADPNILHPYCLDTLRGVGSNMLRSHQPPNHPDEPRGYTALHALSGVKDPSGPQTSATECVSLLVQAGADIHAKSPKGETALHFACVNNINIVKVLLEAGAYPYAETDTGGTILNTNGETDTQLLPILSGSGLVDVSKIMAKSNGGPLFCRLQGHHFDSALELLKYKPDLNVTTPDGNGLLHVLFSYWDFRSKASVLDALLLAGADPNLQNKKGEAPLHLLMGKDTGFETVSRLVKAGADIEIRDAQGRTPVFKKLLGGTELFKPLIDLCARLDTRDNKGQTLLHEAVENTSRLDKLAALMGFDPSVVDNKGNTLFLELASRTNRSDSISIYEHLKKLGVDIDQSNSRGKTVLHKLCSKRPDGRSWNPSIKTIFDHVIQECTNICPEDIDGIQPLHIAAAVSETYVFKLLDSGADVFGVTKEGMAVLHIAARARQPGIIGLILSSIAELNDEKRRAFINQKNTEGSTALHYACCSGRPETVDLLLNAGADPNLPGKGGFTPFRACAEFEIEQGRWKKIGKKETTKAIKAASIWLGTRSVPSPGEDLKRFQWRSHNVCNESDSTGIDEILISLVLHGANITEDNGSLHDAFHAAVSKQRDYTAECLARLHSRFLPNMNLLEESDSAGFMVCKTRLEGERSSLMKEEEKKRKIWGNNAQAMHTAKLLGLRQYSLLEERMTRIDILLLSSTNVSFLHSLVNVGLADILDRVCTSEAALKFDDHEWCGQAEDANHCHRNIAKPLLITACKRELPNMEVVRMLVEKLDVNININGRKESYTSGKREFVLGNGALHDLAEGVTWWNVHQALPYLIRKGANLELRNDDGETPLHVALDYERYKGVFYKDAVKILLDNGADANAVNSKGETCLSKAGPDIELITLLLSYGADVSAIELGNAELLEFFLSQADLANMRRPAPETPERIDSIHQTRIPSAEIYPLLHAATFKSYGHGKKVDLTPFRMRMMTALLQHGADPYLTFTKFHRVNDDSFQSGDELDILNGNSEEKWEPKTCSVIHEILETGAWSSHCFSFHHSSLNREIPKAKL